MTTRWMHPPEIENARKRDGFDPVRIGEQYRLPRELSLAIWKRVCDDATEGTGQPDSEAAQRRFHELANLIAVRGGRILPDVGRFTQVGLQVGGTSPGAWDRDPLAPRTPGRATLVGRSEDTSHQADDLDRDGSLPVTMRARMEHAYGQRFDDVEVHLD